MDVEATTAVRQAEVGAARTMIDRTAERFDVTPSRLVGDAGYGSAEMVGWLVDKREIEPHVKLMDKSERTDGTFPAATSSTTPNATSMNVPAAKSFEGTAARSPSPATACRRTADPYRAIQRDCNACALKPKCCPNMPARKIPRSIHEAARDKARAIAKTEAYAVSRRERKKVEMLFAHLKRILRLGRLRLRGPNGAKGRVPIGRHSPKSPETGEDHPLPGADLRHMRRSRPIFLADSRPEAHRRRRRRGFSTSGNGRELFRAGRYDRP